jgi:hypothetical protein
MAPDPEHCFRATESIIKLKTVPYGTAGIYTLLQALYVPVYPYFT